MSEALHYENPEMWIAERYLADDDELHRFRITTALLPPVKSLLDVGAGNGAFLSVLERERPGMELLGFERAVAAIDNKVCAATIRQGSADELPFEDRAWDVVSSLEVIEHLPYGVYESVLAEFERVAGRYILISVPFRENRLLVQCPYCSCEFNPYYHMRRYEEDDVRNLFRTFRCVEFHTIKTPVVVGKDLLTPAYRWLRRKNGFFPPVARCPQCGFRRETSPSTPRAVPAAGAPARRSPVRRAAGLARRILPTIQRAKWAVALFERKGE